MLESKENAIEFLYGNKEATVTFCSPRYISKIKKLAEERPDECKIVAENEDGSIIAHIPVKWVKITPTRIMTEEQKEAIAERFRKSREKKREEGE